MGGTQSYDACSKGVLDCCADRSVRRCARVGAAGHGRAQRPSDRFKRRGAARCHRDRDADGDRTRADRRDRRRRQLPDLEPADGPLSPGGLAAGIPELRADGARAARSARRRRSTPPSSSARSRRRSRSKPRRRSWTSEAPASATSSRTSGSSSCRSRGVRSTDLIVLSGAAVQTGRRQQPRACRAA